MKKVTILLIALMVISVGFLSGCNEASNILSGEKNKFVGTWKGSYFSITFFSDGSCSYSSLGAIWDIKDEKLVITIGNNELVYSYDYYFSDDNTKLHLKSAGEDDYTTYTKQ